MSSLALEENRSISNNTIRSIRQSFSEGKSYNSMNQGMWFHCSLTLSIR